MPGETAAPPRPEPTPPPSPAPDAGAAPAVRAEPPSPTPVVAPLSDITPAESTAALRGDEDAATATEAPVGKETITKETQQREIDRLGMILLQRKARELDKARKEGKAITSKSDQDILSAYLLDAVDENGPVTVDYRSKNSPKGMDLTTDNRPIKVVVNGQRRTVTHIERFQDKSYICRLEGDAVPRAIPKADIVLAQLIAVKGSILSGESYSQAEQQLLKTYFTLVEGGNLEGQDSTETNELINSAAESAGVLTTDNLQKLASKVLSGEENKADRERVLASLEGKNIADADTITRTLEAVGFGPRNIREQLHSVQRELNALQKLLSQTPDNPDLQRRVANAETQAKVLEKLQEVMGDGQPIRNFFDKMQLGEISAETARQAVQAVTSGDQDRLLEAFGWDNLSEEDKAKLQGFFEKHKGSLFAALILLIASIAATAEATSK